MSQIDRLKRIADKLFLQISSDFHMKFEKGYYVLENPKSSKCHLLEIALIGKNNCTGRKIRDIANVIHMPMRWVLGFSHAFAGKRKKYINIDYTNGCVVGEKARQELVLLKQ